MTNKQSPATHVTATQAIGVFDSGVGGISVLRHIHELLPQENLLYVADSLHAPYGNKSAAEITQRCLSICDFLLDQGAKAIVIACNTATAATIVELRQHYQLPIIGMEPAVKPAVSATKNDIIGVLATSGTLKSAQFAALLENYGQHVRVATQACIGLVECIERGELESDNTRALITQYCQPLLAAGADTIVLGCTHYPFVRPLIEQFLAAQGRLDDVSIIDTGMAVARHTRQRLLDANLLNHASVATPVEIIFFSNSQAANAQAVLEQLWGAPTPLTLNTLLV